MKIITIISSVLLIGCATSSKEQRFEPLPPEQLHDLLHVTETYAYKSVTKKDYIIKETN
jgi:hypothetical protein